MITRAALTLLVSLLPAVAQDAGKLIEQGQKSYAERCAMCHGPEAGGGDMGPKLVGNRRVRSRSTQQLRSFIYDGSPANGMPPFHLPGPELDALAAFVHALNATAAESKPQGDAAAGEQYFFGAGQCSSCHMVGGRGKAIGPDLSNAGREMTLGDIRQS